MSSSSLLQNVLASRLAQASLHGEAPAKASHDEAVKKDEEDEEVGDQTLRPGEGNKTPPAKTKEGEGAGLGSDDWEMVAGGEGRSHGVEDAAAMSDDEMVGVISLPGTVPSTPQISRPPSPGSAARMGVAGGALAAAISSGAHVATVSSPTKKAVPLPTSSLAKHSISASSSTLRKSKTDPLHAFPREVSQRIFVALPVPALIACSGVNKRWRRSATLNYCWYLQCRSGRNNKEDNSRYTAAGAAGNALVEPPVGGFKWTRRESKTDWKMHFMPQRRLEARDEARSTRNPLLTATSSGYSTPSRSQRLRDEGVKTPNAIRQEQWAAQDEAAAAGYSKTEMREYYKSQGTRGGKMRGKSGKGGHKTGSARDGGLWE